MASEFQDDEQAPKQLNLLSTDISEDTTNHLSRDYEMLTQYTDRQPLQPNGKGNSTVIMSAINEISDLNENIDNNIQLTYYNSKFQNQTLPDFNPSDALMKEALLITSLAQQVTDDQDPRVN